MNKSLYIAIPTCRDWKAGFGTSMLQLTSKLTMDLCQGKLAGLHVNCQISSLLPWGRQKMLDDALKMGFTHILWIDDDTNFPAECIDILLSRDVSVVAANMCRKIVGDTGIAADFEGRKIDSSGKEGIEKVGWLGLGLCLMDLSIFKDIPAPHFEIRWLEDRQVYLGEDAYLCEILRQKGTDLYIDHDVSNKIGHIGDFSYGFRKVEK